MLKLDALGKRSADREMRLGLDHFDLERASCWSYQAWRRWRGQS